MAGSGLGNRAHALSEAALGMAASATHLVARSAGVFQHGRLHPI